MGLSDIVERLDKYQKRLAMGKADKIKPRHVDKAIEKLTVKKAQLSTELEETIKPSKRERIEMFEQAFQTTLAEIDKEFVTYMRRVR